MWAVWLLLSSTAQGQSDEYRFWELSELFKTPQFQWLGVENGIRSLKFRSVAYNGLPTEVFAYYANPDLILGKESGLRQFPAVVLLHGGGGKAYAEWVMKWAKRGYAAIALDLTGNDGHGQAMKNPGPPQTEETLFSSIESGDLKRLWTYHSVSSAILAHSLIRSFPEVDSLKTAITGISWGGYLTCIVSALDDRFKAAVPVYGCGYYEQSDVFRESLDRLSPIDKKRWLQYFDPSVYLAQLKMPILFLNGNKDKFFNVQPYSESYSLVADNLRFICIKPDMHHSHEDGWEAPEIGAFIDGILRGKRTPFPSVDTLKHGAYRISAYFSPEVRIAEAVFYYTDDIKSANETRSWYQRKVTMQPNRSRVDVKIRSGDYRFGFFYFTSTEGISFSSPFVLSK